MSKLGIKKSIIAGTVSGLMTLIVATSASAVETDRKLELSGKDVESFMIDSGAGSLTVTGDKNLTDIIVNASIKVEDLDDDDAAEWFKKNMKLTLTKKGDKAILKALFDTNNSFFSFGGNYSERKIDLVVRMPEGLALDIDDGSGHMEVSNIKASLNIDDGSGHIKLEDIGGDTWIDDGSGTLTIDSIGGSLKIDDGSGNIIISSVNGDVNIDDGSGGIDVQKVTKSVYIDDGSGPITVCDVDGDLTIIDKKGADTCNIKGEITIK